MQRRPGLRAAAAALATALLAFGLAALPVTGAGAVGDGNPRIVNPSGTKPLYEGFTGPYVVDFGAAPTGGYSYRVERVPTGASPVTVGSGSFTWTGNGPEKRSFTLPALPPAAEYAFAIVDDATGEHRSRVSFEVRAGAQPRCSLVVPTKLRVDSSEEIIRARLSSNCSWADIDYASWDVKHLSRGTYVNSLLFNGTTTDTWSYFDGQPLGTYAMKPVTAFNGAEDDIEQNMPRTEIRLDSRLSFSATRSGSYVTLRTAVRKYSRSANKFGPWGKHAIALSYRTCNTCAWVHFRTQKTSLGGKATYRFKASATRTYRVTSGGTSSIWAAYPRYLRR